MKQATNSTITHPLARHDRRARSHSHGTFPATDYSFRPETGTTLARAPHTAPDPAATRSFRRMTTELLATQNRLSPLEFFGMVLVTAIIAWPLVDLLIVLAQTAKG